MRDSDYANNVKLKLKRFLLSLFIIKEIEIVYFLN